MGDDVRVVGSDAMRAHIGGGGIGGKRGVAGWDGR
jgi:hypothetical protein